MNRDILIWNLDLARSTLDNLNQTQLELLVGAIGDLDREQGRFTPRTFTPMAASHWLSNAPFPELRIAQVMTILCITNDLLKQQNELKPDKYLSWRVETLHRILRRIFRDEPDLIDAVNSVLVLIANEPGKATMNRLAEALRATVLRKVPRTLLRRMTGNLPQAVNSSLMQERKYATTRAPATALGASRR
jgi:hypothetical protein